MSNKIEVLNHFNKWLLDKYNYLDDDKLNSIMDKADKMLSDINDLYYYANEGHRILYNAIVLGEN
jgi:uncharacterized protein YutE (UPF0331/DUF86 family)